MSEHLQTPPDPKEMEQKHMFGFCVCMCTLMWLFQMCPGERILSELERADPRCPHRKFLLIRKRTILLAGHLFISLVYL